MALRNPLHAMKVAVAHNACRPLVGRGVARLFRDRVPNGGVTVDTSDPRVGSRVKAQLLFGLYERAEIGFIHHYLGGDRDVVELGSSLGVTGSHILRSLPPGRRLIGVEANPHLIPVIEANLAAHAGDRDWALVHAAVSYRDGPIRLQVGAETQGSHLHLAEGSANNATAKPGELVEVPVITLSSVLADHQLDRYDLVCDIEGAEIDLLDREAEALARCDRLIIELHARPGVSVADLRTVLTDRHGFDVLDERGPVLVFGR